MPSQRLMGSLEHQCEVNLFLLNVGAETMTPDELRLQSLAFDAGVSPSDFARDMLADRRRVRGEPELMTDLVIRIVRMEELRERFMQRRDALNMNDVELGASLSAGIDELTKKITADKIVHEAKLEAYMESLPEMGIVA